MSPPIILVALALWLASPASPHQSSSQQPAEFPPTSTQQSQTATPETQAPKPCPASPTSGSPKPADCKSARAKGKKHQNTQPDKSATTGPTKTVVRNGSTPDPTVAISPDVSDEEISRKLNSTDRLLASADANLRQVATRQLSEAQEDTIKQIKVYMEQARTAEKNGEVQRAYTLANKANMLSADLAAPRQ